LSAITGVKPRVGWSKRPVEWFEGETAYVSVPFTWQLPQAYSRCVWLHAQGYKVRAGGPAVSLMPHYLMGVASIGGEVDALAHHNPLATFTSRGCIRSCKFCAVPRVEGELRELEHWEPKPVVCDNNLLACSRRHFDRVVDSLKNLSSIDFNQGLDARLLTGYHCDRLTELNLKMVRLSWDHMQEERSVMDAIGRLRKAGLKQNQIRVYVLIGFDDTPEDAWYRLSTLKKIGVWPYPQRYNPLDALRRDNYVAADWTERQLKRFVRYWSRQEHFAGLPFSEFDETR